MIAEWMVYAAVIAVCASSLAWVLDAWFRTLGRSTRWVWVGAVMASLLIPIGVAVRPRLVVWSPPNAAMTMELPPSEDVPLTMAEGGGALGWLWLGASTALLLLLTRGLALQARVRRRAPRHTMAGRTVAVTRDLGPGAVPFGEPKILVPRWVLALPANAARLLVTHEEEHVRAGDARLLAAHAGGRNHTTSSED